MASEPQILFPNLPPELRNEIYALLSTPSTDSRPLNAALPLSLKTFTCKHTTVQICPTHHGATGLLALPVSHFLEAREYASWLLNNATELQISVHFKGRINTFVQDDWDKKITVHLRKLVKRYPWLNKVPRYHIQVLWDPTDGALKSKGNKRVAGQVLLDMMQSLTQLMDQEVKRKCGHVSMGLHIAHAYAVENARAAVKFGLNRFLAEEPPQGQGLGCWRREVWKAPLRDKAPPPPTSEALLVPCSAPTEEQQLMSVQDGVVTWSERMQGHFVMAMTSRDTVGASAVYEYGQSELEFPVCHVMAECVAG